MLKRSYRTARLELLQSGPQMAADVLAFYRRNHAFLQDSEPLREKSFYSEDFQRRALGRDAQNARELRALRLWMRPQLAGTEDAEKEDVPSLAGMVGLGGIQFGFFRSAFVSYKLDAGMTGMGLMAEALQKLVEIAFNDIGLHRLEANIMPRNTRSLRLVRRLGFQEEGLARQYLKINGIWEDHIHMVLLNAED